MKNASTSMIRLHEAEGSSQESWEAAAADALRSARREIRVPIGLEVGKLWADVKGGRTVMFRAAIRVAYRQTLKAAVPARKVAAKTPRKAAPAPRRAR